MNSPHSYGPLAVSHFTALFPAKGRGLQRLNRPGHEYLLSIWDKNGVKADLTDHRFNQVVPVTFTPSLTTIKRIFLEIFLNFGGGLTSHLTVVILPIPH